VIQRKAVVGGTPAAMHREDTDTRTFSRSRRREIEEDIPRRVREEVAPDELRPHLPVPDDSPHQPGVRQRGTAVADEAVRPRIPLPVKSNGGPVRETGAAALRRPGDPRKHHALRGTEGFETGGDLAHLLRETQQHQLVLVAHLPHVTCPARGEHPAQGDDPVGVGWVDEELRLRLLEAGEDLVQRADGGGDDELRSRHR